MDKSSSPLSKYLKIKKPYNSSSITIYKDSIKSIYNPTLIMAIISPGTSTSSITSMTIKHLKNKSIKIQPGCLSALHSKATMPQSLPMDKLELAKLTPWKDSNTVWLTKPEESSPELSKISSDLSKVVMTNKYFPYNLGHFYGQSFLHTNL